MHAGAPLSQKHFLLFFIVLDILLPTQKDFIAVILGPGQYNKWMMVLQDPDNLNSIQSNGNA